MYSLQIQKVLIQCERLTEPRDRVILLKQGISIADAHNDTSWGFDLRRELISAEKDLPCCVEGFLAITWLLDACDRFPDMFHERDLMKEYKWMLGAARRNSSISLLQLHSIMEDYKKRLLRNSYTLHSYYSVMIQLAYMLGDLDAAQKYIDYRSEEQYDDLSFCKACELHDITELEFKKGNIDEALRVGADLFSRKLYCRYVPFESFCNNINMMRLDGRDECKEWCDIAEKEIERMEDYYSYSQTPYVSMLIRYLSTEDEERAWRLFERYAERNIGSEDYYDFMFSSNVLSLLNREGFRKIEADVRLPWYRQDNIYNLQELHDYYFTRAKELSQRFDRRHGNNCCSQRLDEWRL
ncbi:MAG: hypothetical protein LBC98_02270 [Prevotellaceae bacterium]|jgi:hypothetical protein|nr:hypothetical protein [Prevotellaceae bacterium]